MMDTTFFGEITQLCSRAVFYSDEEDDDEIDELDQDGKLGPKTIEPPSHDTFRTSLQVNFTRSNPDLNLKFASCIISTSSQAKFKRFKLPNWENSSIQFGHFDSYGKAFAFPIIDGLKNVQTGEFLLWLLFDASHQYIAGQEVVYFVEQLRNKLKSEFNLFSPSSSNCEITILSQQFSNSESVEFLSNYTNNQANSASLLKNPIPFHGRPIASPFIIRSSFESSLFEQLTLLLRPALLVCLPSPTDYLFNQSANWPLMPKVIIEHVFQHRVTDEQQIFI